MVVGLYNYNIRSRILWKLWGVFFSDVEVCPSLVELGTNRGHSIC